MWEHCSKLNYCKREVRLNGARNSRKFLLYKMILCHKMPKELKTSVQSGMFYAQFFTDECIKDEIYDSRRELKWYTFV